MSDSIMPEIRKEGGDYFRNRYRGLWKQVVLLGFCSVALAIVLTCLSFQFRNPRYYASTMRGAVVPMYSLREPVLTIGNILQWSSLVSGQAFNIDFDNYHDDVNREKANFTAQGWSKFLEALKNSGLQKNILQNKLRVSAVVSDTPVVLEQGIEGGRYTWKIQLPLLLTYESASQVERAYMMITLEVARVPVLDAPESGIQINNITAAHLISPGQTQAKLGGGDDNDD